MNACDLFPQHNVFPNIFMFRDFGPTLPAGMAYLHFLATLVAATLVASSAVFQIQGQEFNDSEEEQFLLSKGGSDELAVETIWDCWESQVTAAFGWSRSNIDAAVASLPRIFDYVHFACGQRSLDRHLRKANLYGIGYDKVIHRSMDINTDEGIVLAIICVLCLKRGGVLCGGPECKSWLTFMTKHITKRSRDNIEGDETKTMVYLRSSDD